MKFPPLFAQGRRRRLSDQGSAEIMYPALGFKTGSNATRFVSSS